MGDVTYCTTFLHLRLRSRSLKKERFREANQASKSKTKNEPCQITFPGWRGCSVVPALIHWHDLLLPGSYTEPELADSTAKHSQT